MQFNNLEQIFFTEVLKAELDVPVNAVLSFDNEEFPLTIIPQLSEGGYFELRYYGAPAYMPEPVEGKLSWSDSEILGTHPKLKRLWISGNTASLRFNDRPAPTAFEADLSGPNMEAKLILADSHHRGILSINKNQIVVRESMLKRAEFSLVDFPKVTIPAGQSLFGQLSSEGEFENFKKRLNAVSALLPENKAVVKVSPQVNIVLKTDTGWMITLTKDDEETRGCISYSGLITRTEEEEFSVKELSHLLEGLTYFLSFAGSAFRHPTAVIGYDSENVVTWGQIGKFTHKPSSTNWFVNDSMRPATVYLERLFPRFWSAWEKHQNEVNRIIEYYINSEAVQRAGLPREAVATSYAGLDMLAHLLISNPARDSSTRVVERALEQFNVPDPCLDASRTPVTARLATVLGLNRSGVPLLNSVRNYVVHPLQRNSHTFKTQHSELLDNSYSEYFHVHDLSQYFLEYLLLQGLCSYTPERYRRLSETINR